MAEFKILVLLKMKLAYANLRRAGTINAYKFLNIYLVENDFDTLRGILWINPDSALETKRTNAERVGLRASIRVNPDKRKNYRPVGIFNDFIA